MTTYKRYRFSPAIIQYAVWLYYRFNLSHREIEDLLDERGITVSYESIRLWCNKFGSRYTRRLQRNHQGYGDTFYIDEVFLKIGGKQHHLLTPVELAPSYWGNHSGPYRADQAASLRSRYLLESGNMCFILTIRSIKALTEEVLAAQTK